MIRLLTSGFAAMVVVAACAMGGAPTDRPIDAQPQPHKDAHFVTGDAKPAADAHVYYDAPPAHDAAPPDGGGSGGGFCQVNSDCSDPSTCCWVALCIPGTRVGNNLCIPQ